MVNTVEKVVVVVEDMVTTIGIDLVVEAMIDIGIIENIETTTINMIDMMTIEIDIIGVEVMKGLQIEVGVEKELMQPLLTHPLDISIDLEVGIEEIPVDYHITSENTQLMLR